MSNKLIGAAAVILDSDERVLLVKHSYGKLNWDLPGGLAEKNESAQQTAMREVSEETGLSVEAGRLTGIYYEPNHDMHHFVFLCAYGGEQQPVPASPEITDSGYFAIDNLPKPISDFTIQRIRDAIDAAGHPPFRLIGPRKWIEAEECV
ncbi:NUDIX hydrolase [Paenibacillus sp. YIM B09110]|uniref:NUDIX hydrolase n=1 Tax=Paenibacillus sp. YIM B09110 TaxID=3126102 RepID=UPI00301E2979